MKRTERVAALVKILTDSPNKLFSLKYFCELYGAAKSSISEDIRSASDAIESTGTGCLETVPGAHGGVKFIPFISDEKTLELQQDFISRLSDPDRLLGGNFIYTSDIFCDPFLVRRMAMVFARRFRDCGATCVVTIETKGIPLAYSVAGLLSLPLVIIRREARISEGSTLSINYFSGSDERMQKMSMAKRAVAPGSKALIIDDFMRGGGSVVGITNMIHEFNSEVVGVGVTIASMKPEKKKISDYTCLVYLDDASTDAGVISVHPNTKIYD